MAKLLRNCLSSLCTKAMWLTCLLVHLTRFVSYFVSNFSNIYVKWNISLLNEDVSFSRLLLLKVRTWTNLVCNSSWTDIRKYWQSVYHNTVPIFCMRMLNLFWTEVSYLFRISQVGVAETKVAVERTGGIVVLAESFGHSVFKDSLRRIFQSSDSDLDLCFK